MTTLHIVFPDLRFHGLSDVLLHEHLAKDLFLGSISGEYDSRFSDVWLEDWRTAAALAREVELSLGIDRNAIVR